MVGRRRCFDCWHGGGAYDLLCNQPPEGSRDVWSRTEENKNTHLQHANRCCDLTTQSLSGPCCCTWNAKTPPDPTQHLRFSPEQGITMKEIWLSSNSTTWWSGVRIHLGQTQITWFIYEGAEENVHVEDQIQAVTGSIVQNIMASLSLRSLRKNERVLCSSAADMKSQCGPELCDLWKHLKSFLMSDNLPVWSRNGGIKKCWGSHRQQRNAALGTTRGTRSWEPREERGRGTIRGSQWRPGGCPLHFLIVPDHLWEWNNTHVLFNKTQLLLLRNVVIEALQETNWPLWERLSRDVKWVSEDELTYQDETSTLCFQSFTFTNLTFLLPILERKLFWLELLFTALNTSCDTTPHIGSTVNVIHWVQTRWNSMIVPSV